MYNILKQKWNRLASDTRFSEILTGSLWAIAARALGTGFGFFGSILIARLYGAEMVGIVAVIQSFLLLASIFTALGTGTSILRLIPEHLVRYSPSSAFKVYRKTLYMVIAVSLVTGALCLFGSRFIADKLFSKPHLSFYFALTALFVVFKSLTLLNTQAVRGLRLIRLYAFMLLLPQGSNFLFLILLGLVWSSRDVPVYALLGGFAVPGILGWLVMEVAFRRRMQPRDSVHPAPVRTILSISLPMLATAAMTFIIGQTGVVMLGMFRTEAAVGYYAIAVKMATLTSFILGGINSMAAPKFSELFHADRIDELLYVAKKSAKLIFWTTTPILAGLLILGKPMLSIVFGREFAVAYPALVLLVVGQFIHSISGSTGTFMNMTGNQKVFRNIMFVTAMLNIALNLLLIPRIGIHGAAVAATISISFWNGITLVYIKCAFGKTTGYFPRLLSWNWT